MGSEMCIRDSHELAVIVLRGAPSDDDSIRMVDASRVLSDHRSRSRLDWAPMADVVAAYFTPLDVQGAMTVASQNVLGPGRFRPLQHFTSTFDRPSLVDLIRQAATLLFGLIKNHPWEGGNKRTATFLASVFLKRNGMRLVAQTDEVVGVCLKIESAEWKVDEIDAWLRERVSTFAG